MTQTSLTQAASSMASTSSAATTKLPSSKATKGKNSKPPIGTDNSSILPQPDLPQELLVCQNRLASAYEQIIHRELMLKVGPRKLSSVPKLKSITLAINADTDTKLGKEQVPKTDLLLHLLALEILTGQPALFQAAKSGQAPSGRAEGVYVTLTGDSMMFFLEKLVHVVLPNMIGFEGLGPLEEVPPKRPPIEGKRYPKVKPDTPKAYSSDLRISSLLLFPDFERNFDLFEPLGSCHVKFEVECLSPEAGALLLSAFSIPLKKENVS